MGETIPGIGLGTFGSDNYTAEQIADAVQVATDMGYRHFDCAAAYGNEKEVGKAIKKACVRNGLEREDVWITGKLWNDSHDDPSLLARNPLRTLIANIWICTLCIGHSRTTTHRAVPLMPLM